MLVLLAVAENDRVGRTEERSKDTPMTVFTGYDEKLCAQVFSRWLKGESKSLLIRADTPMCSSPVEIKIDREDKVCGCGDPCHARIRCDGVAAPITPTYVMDLHLDHESD